jgi:hypothetical protein
VVLAALLVPSAAFASVTACESVRYTDPLTALAVNVGAFIANGVAHVPIPFGPLDINSTALAATAVYGVPDVISPVTVK